VATGIGTKQS